MTAISLHPCRICETRGNEVRASDLTPQTVMVRAEARVVYRLVDRKEKWKFRSVVSCCL
jgi:hypothetical protein